MQILANLSEVVAPRCETPVVLEDVDDDPIIYTAIAGKANVLCTLDVHFYGESVRSFCPRKGIAIMNDVALLHLIRSRQE